VKPNFNLFLHEGEVWETANPGTDDEVERKYEGPWPVRAFFTSCDCGDGHGWQIDAFRERGQIVDDYLHDVGAGDATYAVLVDVKSPEAFVALCGQFNLEDSEPERL